MNFESLLYVAQKNSLDTKKKEVINPIDLTY